MKHMDISNIFQLQVVLSSALKHDVGTSDPSALRNYPDSVLIARKTQVWVALIQL